MSAVAAHDATMYRLLGLLQEVDAVASRLDPAAIPGVFGPISLRHPKFVELGFLRTVSWLYVLYLEVGKVGIDFLTARFGALEIGASESVSSHPTLVQTLRTYLQHNLSPERDTDRDVQEKCEAWFQRICGTRVPDGDDQWGQCVTALLEEAIVFMEALRACVRAIEGNESREAIIGDWAIRLSRHHPAADFDRVISTTATDLGREHLDIVRFRKRFYGEWTQALSILEGDYDFEKEARKLVELALLSQTRAVLPITGTDIMASLGLAPGRRIGQLLAKAKRLYDEGPCSAEELLSRLKAEAADEAEPAAGDS